MAKTRFSVISDDPFHIKKKLREEFSEVQKNLLELDFSRGEPYNPPAVESLRTDQSHAGGMGCQTIKEKAPEGHS